MSLSFRFSVSWSDSGGELAAFLVRTQLWPCNNSRNPKKHMQGKPRQSRTTGRPKAIPSQVWLICPAMPSVKVFSMLPFLSLVPIFALTKKIDMSLHLPLQNKLSLTEFKKWPNKTWLLYSVGDKHASWTSVRFGGCHNPTIQQMNYLLLKAIIYCLFRSTSITGYC